MARSVKKAASPLPPTPDQGDLLTEPLIGVADVRGARTLLTMPQVFARLSDPAASTVAFTALQAHQSHAWHAFLVQVAAMALHRAGEHTPWTSPERWRQALVALADGSTSAWTLVVGDLSQPAFMQPPVPEGKLDGFKNCLPTPGTADLPLTAKNHDCKSQCGNSAQAQAWFFALITLQTMQGFSGKNNYGIYRMNGGYGNRPGIGVFPGFDLGAAFRKDTAVLIAARSAATGDGGYRDNGIAFLWSHAWNGSESFQFQHLDPWSIECCRRIRIVSQDGVMRGLATSTAAPRVIVPDELTGNVRDPWTPVDKRAKSIGKSLTLPGTGFTYQRIVELLLSPDWQPPPTQKFQAEEARDVRWYGRTLVRGMGKTEGWHEREVPIPERLRSRFATADERDKLAKTAQTMVLLAGVMRLGILKPALRALWDSECNRTRKDASSTADAMIQKGLTRLETAIDAAFFEHLWDHPDDADPWRQRLVTFAQAILDADCGRVGPAVDRWRRIAKAESVFKNRIHYREHPPFGLFSPLPDSIRSPSHDD